MQDHDVSVKSTRRPAGPWSTLRIVGPGLLIAATGVGAGDLVAAAVSGSRYGFAVAWAAAVGGSVTLLSYGYWIRERGWEGPERLRTVRIDLAVAYAACPVYSVTSSG